MLNAFQNRPTVKLPPPPQSEMHEQSSLLEQLKREHSVEQESTTTEALQTQTQSEGKTDLVHCISIYSLYIIVGLSCLYSCGLYDTCR